ncbi:MAG: sigma 54-interacting transcriptional regulator, partial [Proteobacteria bacterium]|nr:sigma 54-interacting transcriptional regulator [Pseudomonadota bacterium]
LGSRRDHPFVAVNLAALPEEFVESELFGRSVSRSSEADTAPPKFQPGKFEMAEGGTLFLDEIGDMPAEAQTRLLRVLQDGEYVSIAGNGTVRANVRIIAATNCNLHHLMQQGLFREDLFYRLNVVPLRLPPLRERSEDIAPLVAHFLAQGRDDGLPVKSFAPEAIKRLKGWHWPGNVRELENLVRRLAVLHDETIISAEAVEAELSADVPKNTVQADSLSLSVETHIKRYFDALNGDMPPLGLYGRVLREVEEPLIVATLAITRGNQLRAADILGLNRNTLRKKIKELNIKAGR